MISVVIPCFNSEEFISRAITSVLNQSYKDVEIILVDNGSTDGTIELLEYFASQHPSKIHLFHEPKKGAPAARNKGLREAKGEWIQFLDSDDELLPNKLAKQIKIAQSANIDLVIGDIIIYKNNGSVEIKQGGDFENPWRGLLNSRLGRTSGNLWRRRAVIAVDGWNERKSSSQEYDLMFRMMKNNSNLGFDREALTLIHVRENSIHISDQFERNVEIVDNFVNLRLEIKDYLKSKNLMTNKLSEQADVCLYIYLMKFRSFAPEYIEGMVKKLRLNLPITFVLRKTVRTFRLKLFESTKSMFFGQNS
jgi:glycosyltransferase involved in cell wall biosynthesis